MHEMHVLPGLDDKFREVLFHYCSSPLFYRAVKQVEDALDNN